MISLQMKPYSLDLRQKIIDAYIQGEDSIRGLASRFKVARSFVQKLIKRYQTQNTIEPLPSGKGFVSKLEKHKSAIAKFVEEDNDATLEELCQKLYETTGLKVSQSAMCRFLKKLNLTLKKSHSMPLKQEL